MAEVILMPRLSDTMTEGVIAAWHKKIGDPVKKGDLLAEVETDKATMELESYKDGTLLHIGSEQGGKLQVNDLLAIIGAPGEDVSSLIKENSDVSRQSAVGSQQSAVGSQQSAPDSYRDGSPQAATKNKSAGSGGQQATSNQQPVTSNQEPVTSNQQPATSNQQPATSLQDSVDNQPIDISKMDEVVLMPRLSDTMEEGVIASWNKQVGDTVKKGDVLADIETDKATLELESYKNGTLLYIGAEKGEKIPVNGLLCIIGEKGKVNVEAIVAAAQSGVGSQESGVGSSQSTVGSQQSAVDSPQAANKKKSAGSGGQPTTSSLNGDERVKASPLARRLASEKGIDISKISGSGDGGRITKSDIDNYKEETKGHADAARTGTIPTFTAGEEGYTDISNSQIRTLIAKRLGESKFSAPHFYLTMEINMDNTISARTQLNEISPVKISFNDLVVKAAALALRQHPAVNASWLGDKIRRYHHIHIGIAVAIEDGLIVPVIRFADQKTLPQIAAESKELSGRARIKKLQPHEFTGNTFTISNLGMMDIDEFTAIINPPDSCIMAVGKIKEVVVKKPEGFGLSNVMKVTLSCDHRSVDGATGAAFLQTFKKYLENPVMMLL